MPRLTTVPDVSITLDEAIDLTRTGDVWLFRGRKAADRAIQVATNSPINHAGMSVVIDDLPPLMWHAELGRSLPDVWSGSRHRGVQLHDLRDAVIVWANRYGQRAWLRQLDHPVTREMEDAILRTVARLDGTPFPSTSQLAGRWLAGRVPDIANVSRDVARAAREAPHGVRAVREVWNGTRGTADGPGEPGDGRQDGRAGGLGTGRGTRDRELESAYCAEVLAVTYQAMGLLTGRHHASWYDPGRFWSGDDLRLSGGFRLGGEIAVEVPAAAPGQPPGRSPAPRRR
jgi:hypothetical protein